MARHYDIELLEKIKYKQRKEQIDGIDVTMKYIPDSNVPGAMDPRVYQGMKKMLFATRFIPKKKLQLELNEEALPKVRAMFNSIDSSPIITEGVTVEERSFKTDDGTAIPMYIFKGEHTLEHAPILYYIHGGGFFAGSTAVVEEAMKVIVAHTQIIVCSIDYRLAPEHPYPTGHEDCYAGLKWVYAHAAELGGDPQNIFVSGDSAGGNLTLYCTNRSLEDKLPMVKGQLILYPTVNMGGVSDKHVDFSKDKYDISRKHARAINMTLNMMGDTGGALGTILGTDDVMNHYLTPYMDVNPNMPPTFVTVGEHDFLKIETLAYARKLVKAGVETKTIVYKGLGHAYLDRIGFLPQSEDCAIEMGNFILKYAKRNN